MSADTTEAGWQLVFFLLKSLWQSPGAAGRVPGKTIGGGWGDRAVTQTIQDAAVLDVWEDEGGAVARRRRAPKARALAHRRALPARQEFPSDVVPRLLTPARSLKT
jgi:hypothetical protein